MRSDIVIVGTIFCTKNRYLVNRIRDVGVAKEAVVLCDKVGMAYKRGYDSVVNNRVVKNHRPS